MAISVALIAPMRSTPGVRKIALRRRQSPDPRGTAELRAANEAHRPPTPLYGRDMLHGRGGDRREQGPAHSAQRPQAQEDGVGGGHDAGEVDERDQEQAPDHEGSSEAAEQVSGGQARDPFPRSED